MRVLPIIVLSLLIGSLLGAGSAYWSIGPQRSANEIEAIRTAASGTPGEYPKFAIDSKVYDFGSMQRGTTRSHAFQVTNEGTKPLTVEVIGTTCKCTAGNVGNGVVDPGETKDITLEWSAKSNPGAFRQTATLGTNDPRFRRVELTVEGIVTTVSGMQPEEFFFDRYRPGDDRTESVYLMAFEDEDLQIESATIEREEARESYDVQVVKVADEDLPDPNAKVGYRIDVSPKGAIALGPLHEWVLLETNFQDTETLRIPIMGTVVGDIEIRGPGQWNEVTGAVHFGDVQSEQGAEIRLFLNIGGEHASDTTFEVAEVDPETLEIEIGEAIPLRDDMVKVPLTVRVPEGSPPAIRNGTGLGEEGRVVLKTNHPINSEISFGVRYVIKRPQITK